MKLTKEARVMPNSGVSILENEIQVPFANGARVSIDLVDPAETEPTSTAPLATALLLALQTFLSHAHHVNLKKRQEVPEPLSTKYLSTFVANIGNPKSDHCPYYDP